jgi:hypothetical protein
MQERVIPCRGAELKLFRQKIEDRFGCSTHAFLIAMNGYTETTKIEERTRRGGQSLAVLLTREEPRRTYRDQRPQREAQGIPCARGRCAQGLTARDAAGS